MPTAEPAIQQRADQACPDEELVRRVNAGDTALFEILMRRNNQRLYRAVRSVLRDEGEVEDVMQQTYVLAFTHLDQFAATAKWSTWLLRIGVNEALGRLRKRRRQPLPVASEADETEPVEDPMPTPEDATANRELAGLLEETIDRLPPLYREVFVLRLVEGLDTAEVASVLGLGDEAVKQRLHRARGMVREAIEERVGGLASTVFEFHAPRCDRVVAGVMARLAAG